MLRGLWPRNFKISQHIGSGKVGKQMKRHRWAFFPVVGALALAGCGHTDEEMAEKQRAVDKLSNDLKNARSLHEEDQRKYLETQADIDKLRNQLEQAGVSGQKSKEELERLQK